MSTSGCRYYPVNKFAAILALCATLFAAVPNARADNVHFMAGEAGIVLNWKAGSNLTGYSVVLSIRSAAGSQEHSCSINPAGTTATYIESVSDFAVAGSYVAEFIATQGPDVIKGKVFPITVLPSLG